MEVDYEEYYRQDDLDLKTVQGKIQIWLATGLMDGGTIILHCRYEDKVFQIISRQFTIEHKHEQSEFLYLNERAIVFHSEEEKIILKLIQESINAADSLWFVPIFIKILLWSKRKKGYWVYIFKREILNFAKSKEYLQLANSGFSDSSTEK